MEIRESENSVAVSMSLSLQETDLNQNKNYVGISSILFSVCPK